MLSEWIKGLYETSPFFIPLFRNGEEMNTYKVIESFSLVDNLPDEYFRIKTKSKEFMIHFTKQNIPHLLGLHYMNHHKKIESTNRLIKKIIEENLSDQYILGEISKYHNQYFVNNVKYRIATLYSFMTNLENAYIVENTHPKTKIKSQYLAIKDDEKMIGHLGILELDGESILLDFEVDKSILETYFKQQGNRFYQDSNINERIEYLEAYQEVMNEWQPFSFNELKQLKLEHTDYGLDNEIYQDLIEEVYFAEETSFLFEDFRFYPVKAFSEQEVENLLSNVAYDGLNYSFMSQKIKLDKLYPEEYKDFNDYFYTHVPKDYQDYELFYCKETRNLYLPTHNGLQKYIGYNQEIYLELLKDTFRKRTVEIKVGEKIETVDGKGLVLQKDVLRTLVFMQERFYYYTNMEYDHDKKLFNYQEKEVFENLGLTSQTPMGLQGYIEILSKLKEDNYFNYAKSFISVETGIYDEDSLDKILDSYLNQSPDEISELINDFFVKEVEQEVLPFQEKDLEI